MEYPKELFVISETFKEWNVSFKSRIYSASHLVLPNTENVSLSKGYDKLFFAILIFRCLKSVTTLL